MAHVLVGPGVLCAWKGQSLLVVNARGECGDDEALSGFYFREARYLRTLRLEIDGERPWLCETAALEPDLLRFAYVHPELTEFGGGGTGQSQDGVTTDARGIPHRSLDLRATYRVGVAGLEVALAVTNRSARVARITLGWALDADFADIQEAQGGRREQEAAVTRRSDGGTLCLAYAHDRLPYRTRLSAGGPGPWHADERGLWTTVQLEQQSEASVSLRIRPEDYRDGYDADAVERRDRHWRGWHDRLTRVEVPGGTVAEAVIRHNVRDFASFPLLQGAEDEWLAMQAGVPAYPALFSRDTITAGWQAAFLDRGASLDASLTRLGRMQSDRVDDWHDEEPGRIPFQLRQGPLARLDLNPFGAYYGDFASPLMFVVALAHLYAWVGERACLARHWDTARRVLDWARDYGDMDGDGYLEYRTRSSRGTKNQGWKDSGDAIVYDDGTPVPPPIATCELQGYWFAAQQLMAALSWAMGARGDARAHWDSALELKARFNRDWWMPEERAFALAMDPDKRLVCAVTSNVGHCVASGIVSAEHLPATVGRLFAPDMFSGWGIRTLSTAHASYNPISYHLGSVWAVEQSTIVFGLRRFGFDTRAQELARALFDLAQLYPEYRVPECVGGYARGERPVPGAYPRANTPQLWNASAFPLLVHALLGLQPVAPLQMLVVDPVLPDWLPEVVLHGLRLGPATATLRFWRDERGASHAEVLHKRGTLHLLRQPPIESLSAGVKDRFSALADGMLHH
ncbi:MAG: glycogen debranching N-terminal domain-containing protein [Gemmatimonadaceae bacterium]